MRGSDTPAEVVKMLKQVRIQGFKSLSDVTVDLGQINVFIGANASGKTAILEALGVLGAAAARTVDDTSLRDRGVRLGTPKLYKTAFHAGGTIRRAITLDATWTDPKAGDFKYQTVLDNPIDKPKPAWRIQNERLDQQCDGTLRHLMSRGPAGAKLSGEIGKPRSLGKLSSFEGALWQLIGTLPDVHPARDMHQTITRFAIFNAFSPMLRDTVVDVTPANPIGLLGGGVATAFRELAVGAQRERLLSAVAGESTPYTNALTAIRRFVVGAMDWVDFVGVRRRDGSLMNPSVPGPSQTIFFQDRYMREGRDILSAYEANEGALYVLYLALLTAHPGSPQLLAIDNADQALHPRLANRAITWMQEYALAHTSRQLLLTTHNPLVLDALHLKDDRVRLFTVDRMAKGQTVVKRIEYTEGLHRLKEGGKSLSQLWMEGMIGGVPPNL